MGITNHLSTFQDWTRISRKLFPILTFLLDLSWQHFDKFCQNWPPSCIREARRWQQKIDFVYQICYHKTALHIETGVYNHWNWGGASTPIVVIIASIGSVDSKSDGDSVSIIVLPTTAAAPNTHKNIRSSTMATMPQSWSSWNEFYFFKVKMIIWLKRTCIGFLDYNNIL